LSIAAAFIVVGTGNDAAMIVVFRRAVLAGALRVFAVVLARVFRVFVAIGILISDAPRASVK
jgi:hypothetical protein